MRCTVELPNVHDVVFVFEHCGFVVVDIEIVGGAEDCHDTGKACRPRLTIHAVPGILRFVRANDGQQVISFEKGACGRIGEEVGTASNMVVHKEL